LLRDCIEGHGGYVVKSVGDGFCAAFNNAIEALNAAIAAQLALQAEAWPPPIRLRSRMALHAGAADLRDGDYFGPTLNRASRLLALGHGGQTLLSGVTQDLLHDQLPAGITLRVMGEHVLKDLARPESVFQVCHPELPDTFPRLRSSQELLETESPSIAVLPFVNMSADESNEYFADGLSEELLNVLAKIRGFRVASRTSAWSFKGQHVDIPTVARKLNVANILEGSVRQSGKRVRITAQLIAVATDSHLWSETYDRELEDIFAVQDDIAKSVVQELRRALLGEHAAAVAPEQVKAEVAAAAQGRGSNPEAYKLYLQGRFFVDRWTREDEARGIAYFQQAVAVDASFALAWAGLSRAYANEAGYGWAPFAEGYGRARAAAERALALEPSLAEGHAALAGVRMAHDWDWPGADASFRRALELSPGNADVMRSMAILVGCMGRLDEAIALDREAVALDPLSVPAHRALGRWYLYAGMLDEAEDAVDKALALNPKGGFANYWLGLTMLAQGRADDALRAIGNESNELFRLLGLAIVQHARNRTAASDAALEQLVGKHAAGNALQIAQAHAFRGEPDAAFRWLERGFAERDPGLIDMKPNPLFRNLHADARWAPFLQKMGLSSGL
jgi:TolB-like protein/Flp pilus assembly protein TadD